MPKKIQKTKDFVKVDDKRFTVKITETIETEKQQNFTIKDILSEIELKQKAITDTEQAKLKSIAQSDETVKMLQDQIATLEALIIEAQSNGITE